MPVMQLTKRNIDKLGLTDSGQVDYFDTELKGLFLRVGQTSKTFYVKTEVRDPVTGRPKTVKAKLQRYGEITAEQARQQAPDVMQRLRDNKPADEVLPPTLRQMYNQYVNDKKLKHTTAQAYKVYFENENGIKFPTWMDLPLNELARLLTPEIVIRRYQEVLSMSGKGAASNSFKMLQAIMGYAMILYPQHISRNPVKVITDAELWPEIKARTTCIEPDQLKQFHDALLTFPAIHRDCYLFTLYQGLRPDEAHSLQWADVNLEKKLFDLTWMDSETKHRGILPLSRQSMEILNKRKAAMQEGDKYVFPSIVKKSKNGHIILRADKLRPKTGLEVTPHSLRRTFTTIGERLRLRREDVNLLTNHIDQTVTGKHYSRIGVEDLRAPLQAICNEIERLMVVGSGAKVIPINRQAA